MLRSIIAAASIFFIITASSFSNQVYLTLIKELTLSDEPTDILLYEDKAFIIANGNLSSFYISDPYNIKITSYEGIADVTSIAFTGRYAYVSGSFEGIRFYDITKSEAHQQPTLKNTIPINGSIKKIVIDNGYLFVVNNDIGLQVYDVNTGDFPIYKNTQILTGDANGIFVKDKKAYVTSSNANLTIIDLNNLSQLPVIGSYNYGVSFYEPYVDGTFAYVPQGITGVQVLNISKLPFPEFVGSIFARKFSKQVVSSNFYVWVADEHTVEGFYNKESKTFMFAGNYDNGLNVINKIAVVEGKYIYVCSNDKKIKVLRIDYKN